MTDLQQDKVWDDEQHVRALAAIASAIDGLIRALEVYRHVRQRDGREQIGTRALRRSLSPLLARVSAVALTVLEERSDRSC